jgi:hypothetical protein
MFSRENSFCYLQAVSHQARRDVASLDAGVMIGQHARMLRESGAIPQCTADVIRYYERECGLRPTIRRLHRNGLRELYGCSLKTYTPARAVVY